MDNDLSQDVQRNLANKTELERTISAGIQGAPELKHDEKIRYLGEFRERILKALTKGQVMKNSIYPQISEALTDKRASKMLLNGDIAFKFREKYQKIADQLDCPFTIIHDPELKGDIGLVISCDRAIDVENIYIED